MATLLAAEFEPEKLAELGARYGHYFKLETVPELCAEHGLTHPMLEMLQA
jgi:hypothetical protein